MGSARQIGKRWASVRKVGLCDGGGKDGGRLEGDIVRELRLRWR